jgi:uncharacterized phage protein (TIGR01671 family)
LLYDSGDVGGARMREPKFRVWNKTMHHYRHFVLQKGVSVSIGADLEIEQYTGLKDKNGKEIYEGDIIRCHGDDRFIAPVIRHAKSGGFCWVSCYDEICFIPESDEVEVIGNIHENGDLC